MGQTIQRSRTWRQVAAGLLVAGVLAISGPALAQTVRQQDISAQLQSSLEQSAPTLVYFGFDQDTLSPETKSVLDQQARWLTSNSTAKVDLAGHTDAVGSNAYNDDLAMRRARAVERYLFQQGVFPEQMRSVVSRGENELAVSTQSKERLNRRVTTRVTGLVEIVEALPVSAPPPPIAPTIAPTIAPRSYAEFPGKQCHNVESQSAQLIGLQKDALHDALSARLDKAAQTYASDAAARDTNNLFQTSAFVKVQCGIAIGYVQKGIRDTRSIGNCTCLDTVG